MNEYLNAEEFETLRKKQLYELQQAAADRDKTRAWRMVFMKRPLYDNSDPEYIWVPVQPYESMVELVARNERGCAEAMRAVICQHCGTNSRAEWKGWDSFGRQQWVHYIQVELPGPKPSLLAKLCARFGYSKEYVPEFAMDERMCPAAPIIQMFHLIDPPSLPGVNTGAYPSTDYNPGFGDPEAKKSK